VTQFDKADITELEAFRKQYGDVVKKQGGKLTVTAILLKTIAIGLGAFPKFNASLDIEQKQIVYKKYINVGVAVDTERGLLVPVIRDADKKDLTQLALELGRFAEKARNKKLAPDEMEGGNFTISNLGGIGGTNFTPIVYWPQVAILGVDRAQIEPVYRGEQFEPRTILPLSLSYDHRIIDGAEGAHFLHWIAQALEHPFLMFMNTE
jgi:pyruvate dehydrogenase E2 component (dihydrolipoamide acetyltransferase)